MFLAFLSLSLGLLAHAELSPYTLHEKRTNIPAGWTLTRRHDASSVLPLRFGLAQSNIHNLASFLDDVSHPDSPNYGDHWTAAQVAKTFAPSDETVETVKAWLISSGLSPDRLRVSPTKGWLEVNATVQEAEDLLLAEYHVYTHDSGKEHVASSSYHLPSHITHHVELVTPSIHFNTVISNRFAEKRSLGTYMKAGQPGSPGKGPKTTGEVNTFLTELEDCDKQITPDCLRALYGLVYEPLSGDNNSYGIAEYTPQAYLQSDLDMFNRNFSADLVGKSPIFVSIDGGVLQTENQSLGYNGESDLDLQYAMSLVTSKQNVTLYQSGDIVQGASFENLLDALDGSYCTFEGGDDPEKEDAVYPDPHSDEPGAYEGPEACGTVKPANVISTSYQYNEADLSVFYTSRQCAEYGKLGLMGVTILYGSGDSGVAGSGTGCLNPDGSQSANGTIFNPSFPSTCPYVSSVGATQVNPGAKVTDPESAAAQVIFTSGGFSNRFAMPSYQANAVGSYFTNYKPPYSGAIYNASQTSRGYPDLSANGINYVIASNGVFQLVQGTSAASPTVGAILTMVNDARITAGKKPIGFINPTIYSDSFKDAFNDITNGTNPGCGTDGFSAVPGWDPVTGLGTPNFPKLVAKWLLLP
ncbi:subtilisin-like protein [Mycena maculata]|uniref:tripeptidyl-peptidase II n=1 Tax=Mycena maculata TaxID=230809 RepID=A0AAD7JCY5_9AGAR|nr:subtilisin-like protein [Mycena maculata]